MQTNDPASLVQDEAGVHVSLHTSGSAEEARQLMLDYGTYSAQIIA